MWFSEVLDDHDSTLNYEHDNAFKADDTKMWSFKVKSGVKDASLSVGQDVVDDGKGGFNHKHKSEMKVKATDEWDLKLISSNKEHEVEAEYKPADLNKNGQSVEFDIEAKYNPAKNAYSGEIEVKAGGFDMGPIKPWSTLKFSTNDKGDHEVNYSQNLAYEKDFHAAWDLNLNKDMALSSAFGYLAMVGPNGNYYLRSNLLNPFVGAGTWFKNGVGKHHFELQYDTTGKNMGMFGQPAFLRYGLKTNFKGVKVHLNSTWGETVSVKEKWTMPINKNLNLSVILQVNDMYSMLCDATSGKVTTGLAAEFKI